MRKRMATGITTAIVMGVPATAGPLDGFGSKIRQIQPGVTEAQVVQALGRGRVAFNRNRTETAAEAATVTRLHPFRNPGSTPSGIL
jgi:hypothetical protein